MDSRPEWIGENVPRNRITDPGVPYTGFFNLLVMSILSFLLILLIVSNLM